MWSPHFMKIIWNGFGPIFFPLWRTVVRLTKMEIWDCRYTKTKFGIQRKAYVVEPIIQNYDKHGGLPIVEKWNDKLRQNGTHASWWSNICKWIPQDVTSHVAIRIWREDPCAQEVTWTCALQENKKTRNQAIKTDEPIIIAIDFTLRVGD